MLAECRLQGELRQVDLSWLRELVASHDRIVPLRQKDGKGPLRDSCVPVDHGPRNLLLRDPRGSWERRKTEKATRPE